MKTIISCMFILMMLHGVSVRAQRGDSLRQQQTDSAMRNPVIPGLQSPDLTKRAEFTEENSVIVLPTEIPPALSKTLQQVEYRGWENGRIFRNTSTNEYKVEMIEDPYLRVFFFDKNGERIVE